MNKEKSEVRTFALTMNRAWSIWSIGVLKGDSPFDLHTPSEIENPVLSRCDISDVTADFVADPFMLRKDDSWYMFFEVMNRETRKGEIGLATSGDGLNWSYRQVVLSEPFHLSYPYAFEFEGEHYMLPETLSLNAVQLYRAETFPFRWSRISTLIDARGADPSIFRFADRWWMFLCVTPDRHDSLALYFADDLKGPWREHPRSPIVKGDLRRARPAGRVLVFKDRIIRFAQDCYPRYGSSVRAFEIRELTPTDYAEEEIAPSPILKAGGRAWNRRGMHHIDATPASNGVWIACVDGFHLSDD